MCEIWGFHGDEDSSRGLLSYEAVLWWGKTPMNHRTLLLPSLPWRLTMTWEKCLFISKFVPFRSFLLYSTQRDQFPFICYILFGNIRNNILLLWINWIVFQWTVADMSLEEAYRNYFTYRASCSLLQGNWSWEIILSFYLVNISVAGKRS
jgi:hypothetical protein